MLLLPVTSRLNEPPPFPIVATFPETDLTACCCDCQPCFPPCCAAERAFADAPRTSRPAREAQKTVFRIIDIGVSLLVMEGGVGILVQVPLQFRNYPSQSAKKCAALHFVRPISFMRRLCSAPANLPNSIASYPTYKRELYSHHNALLPQVNTVELPKTLLIARWLIHRVRKTGNFSEYT